MEAVGYGNDDYELIESWSKKGVTVISILCK